MSAPQPASVRRAALCRGWIVSDRSALVSTCQSERQRTCGACPPPTVDRTLLDARARRRSFRRDPPHPHDGMNDGETRDRQRPRPLRDLRRAAPASTLPGSTAHPAPPRPRSAHQDVTARPGAITHEGGADMPRPVQRLSATRAKTCAASRASAGKVEGNTHTATANGHRRHCGGSRWPVASQSLVSALREHGLRPIRLACPGIAPLPIVHVRLIRRCLRPASRLT